jgi:hypothetical protein
MDRHTPAVLERQWACIRTLRDEVVRYAESEHQAAALREQLEEEETRLAQLLGATISRGQESL